MNRRLYRVPLMLLVTLWVTVVLHLLRVLYGRVHGPLEADALGATGFNVWGRLITRIAGIKLVVDPARRKPKFRGQLIVSNHQATSDSIVLHQYVKAVPVGRGDLRKWPLLGFITQLSGMLWIERGDRGALVETIRMMVAKLEAGFNVSLYPEGTSSDGRRVLPFNASVFQAPVKIGRPILPVSILYLDKNGLPLSDDMREVIMWFSDIGFEAHSWRFLNHPGVQCRLRVGELIEIPASMPPGKARKWLCDEAYRVVSEGLAALTAEAEARAAARAQA
ncbi:MAG: 1-acyl-sn-glycerol-3-phosphate acyltransferase [Proteobacteria bacterium]|nr:1-acyl-sn-glycerol-3-phosphate acyltransferase [Pseudomonadota bacterium]MBU1741771.1 1-acyl-sn-glycerol-3-phosphate acyltransferase [Pseudomonadota bacterium]